MKIDRTQITGLVLAGGRGSRMGGVDKGLQPFRGTTMVQHVLERLQPQVGMLMISANQNRARYAQLRVPVWPDDQGDFAGPLAGLQAGLRHCSTAYLAVAPCDSPLLPLDLVGKLADALSERDADLAFAVSGDGAGRRTQPVFCLLKTDLSAQLDAYLQAGGRKIEHWFGTLNAVEVAFGDADAFSNVNTLADLHALGTSDRAVPPAATSVHAAVSAIAGYDANAMPVAQARAIISEVVTPVRASDTVPILAALDRILALDVVSPVAVPAHDNSAMDGYALRGADLDPGAPLELRIVGSAYAGHPYAGAVDEGQCVRIMTGAVMPADCDTVIAQEYAQAADGLVTIAAGAVKPGANRRFTGEDLAAGAIALKRGKWLRPADIGLLASLGIADVAVYRRVRVAFFSTGDELRSVGQPLDEGCVYDSNRYTIYCMLKRLGCEIVDLGVVRDDPSLLDQALRTACETADVVITSGGVSAGAADYTKQQVEQLGECVFWSLAMRPGRPLAFGRLASNGRGALWFGLPGNPVAVMVSFYFFAREAILRMMGVDEAPQLTVHARATAAMPKRPGRTEYQRGIAVRGADGCLQVSLTGAQGSGILSSMSAANCIVVLGHEQGAVQAGGDVELVLFDGLV